MFPSGRNRKRKKKGKVKGFKTKHKNIYDPEFLKDLETIISRISRIPVGGATGFPRPPTIFQRRNYVCPSLLSKRRYANVIRPPICRAFPTPSPVCFDANYLSNTYPSKKPETSFTRPDSASTRYSITSNLYDFVSSDEESPAPARTSKLSSPGSFSSEASPYSTDRRVNTGRPSPLSKEEGSVKSKSDSPASSKSFEKSANAFISELANERRKKFKSDQQETSSERLSFEPTSVRECEPKMQRSSSFADEDLPLSVRRERRKSEDGGKVDPHKKAKLNASEEFKELEVMPFLERVGKSPVRRGRRPSAKSAPPVEAPSVVDPGVNAQVEEVVSSVKPVRQSKKSVSKSVERSQSTDSVQKSAVDITDYKKVVETSLEPCQQTVELELSVECSSIESRPARATKASINEIGRLPSPSDPVKEPKAAKTRSKLRSPSAPDSEPKTVVTNIVPSPSCDEGLTPKRRGRPPRKIQGETPPSSARPSSAPSSAPASCTPSDHVDQAIESVVINSSDISGEVKESSSPAVERVRTRVRRSRKDEVAVAKEEGIPELKDSEKPPPSEPIINEKAEGGEVKKGKGERKKGDKGKRNGDEASKDVEKNGSSARRRLKKVNEEEQVKVSAVEQHLPLKKRHHHLTEAKADSPKSSVAEDSHDVEINASAEQVLSVVIDKPEDAKAKRGIKRRTVEVDPPVNTKMISPKKRHLLQPTHEMTVISCDLVENHVPPQDDASFSDPIPVLPDVIPIMNPVPKITLRIKNIDGAPQVTSVSMKKVKRKKINRTGFPNKRKKKRAESGTEPGSTESDFDKRVPVLNATDFFEVRLEQPDAEAEQVKPNPESDRKGKPDSGKSESVKQDFTQLVDKSLTLSVTSGDEEFKTSVIPKAARRVKVVKNVKLAHLRRKRNQPVSRPLRSKSKSESEPQSVDENGVKRSLRSAILKSPVSDEESIPDGCLPPCDFPSEIGSDPSENCISLDEDGFGPGRKSPQKRGLGRKKFIPAGLFSSCFKDPEGRKRLCESPTKMNSYDPNDNPSGLLPLPLHSTKWLCVRKVNYHLPHDCWSMKSQGLLPGKTLPSWAYKKIRNNVYYDVKPPIDKETHICSCKPPSEPKGSGCGDDCLNRVCYTECLPSLCPVATLCSNQRIQKHQWAQGLQRFMTQEKGFGIKTKLPIKVGDFIVEYTGEVVSESEFRDRMTGIYVNDVHHYCLNLDGGLVIDGHRMGSEARFVNHSCAPNCEMQKWNVNGLSRMCVFALRDIHPGEELVYDYNFYLFNPDEGQTCRCAALECRGVIGGKTQRLAPIGQSLGPVINTRSGKVIKTKGELKAMPKSPPKQLVKQQRSRISEEDEGLKDIRRIHTQYLKPIPRLYEEEIPCIKEKRCFLIRNYEKVRRRQQKLILRAENASLKQESNKLTCPSRRKRMDKLVNGDSTETSDGSADEKKSSLLENGEDVDTLKSVFTVIINKALSLKDEFGTAIVTLLADAEKSFLEIVQRISNNELETPSSFDGAVRDIFRQLFVMFPLNSVLGKTVARLRRVYFEAKLTEYTTVEKLTRRGVPASFISDGHPNILLPEEEVVVCLCGLPHDEGLMVQCESCETWQHASCVHVGNPDESYICFKCTGKLKNKDRCVILQPQPEDPPPGHEFYLSYVSKDLHLKQGDHVYVLRDHDTIGLEERLYGPEYDQYEGPLRAPGVLYGEYTAKQLDIFLIERIFKDEKDKVFVYGHHYLRPHETYHEPSRRFYPNEVLHMPLYESIPVWAVMGRCWVLDLKTYCKGRPRDSVDEHLYLCELRVDKLARMFSKCPKPKFPYSTKNFAFQWFDARLKPVKNYQPHPSDYPVAKVPTKPKVGTPDLVSSPAAPVSLTKKKKLVDKEEEVPLAKVREEVKHVKLFQKKERLDRVAIRLLAKRATKEPPLDASYLLERKRQKKKISTDANKEVTPAE